VFKIAALLDHQDFEVVILDKFQSSEDSRRAGADDDDVVGIRHETILPRKQRWPWIFTGLAGSAAKSGYIRSRVEVPS
jgi:hypothetical protein